MALSPFHEAAASGSVSKLKELLLGTDVNSRNNASGDTPLHLAAKNGHKVRREHEGFRYL
jgi:ankyrin repeat protein